ncbi:TraB/GumN family protein [Brevundimonas sp.]|uniref:TraB/GumN family protein n=1 Tax=Brevundimonas sp. TaxID=1871086 RepID=UPI0035B154D2
MTFRPLRLAAGVARAALGTALGLGLAAAIAFQPAEAFAQATAAAPAPAAVELPAIPRADGTGPALWVVRDADSTIYLFGTVHMLRPTTAWGSERVERAFAEADELWLEISNPDDQAALVPLIQQHGVDPSQRLSLKLSSGELTLFDNAARMIGANAVAMDNLRPWLAALTLSIAPLQRAGYDPQSGVELILKARAEAAGKPVKGFETIDKQVRILAGFPEADQMAFLTSTLDAFEDAPVELDRLVEAWARGDVAVIEELGVGDMREESEEIYQALLVRRNADWAGQIQQLLAGEGTAFVAVGAAHLAGDDSVQSLLEQRGVNVETVQ